jgi:glycosyltransferase involved in cell wall biosynthesis
VKRDLVSVIIPTYNRSGLCKKAVDSVLRQTYSNVEVIVVDDGSIDDTRDVMSNIDPRVKYIWQENAGVSAARNTGFDNAQGSFIALLDSDDAWLEWKLEMQMLTLRHFPEAGMVWTDMEAVNEKGEVLSETYLKTMYSAYRFFDWGMAEKGRIKLTDIWERCPSKYADRDCVYGDIFRWMFNGNLVHTSTALLRRERLKSVGGFDMSLLKSGEDYDFHLRTCLHGDVAYIDVSSIHYRIGAADQLTAEKYWIWLARNNLLTVEKILTMVEGRTSFPDAVVRNRLAESHAWVGCCEVFENDGRARKHLWESLKLKPFQGKAIYFMFLSLFPPNALRTAKNIKRRLLNG